MKCKIVLINLLEPREIEVDRLEVTNLEIRGYKNGEKVLRVLRSLVVGFETSENPVTVQ